VRETARYDYHNADSTVAYTQVKFENPKSFRPQMPDGSWGLTCPRVLYNMPQILEYGGHTRLFIVEGEKDADRMKVEGFLATTSGSSSSWKQTDTTLLLQVYDIVIVPDCDEAGKLYADAVGESQYRNHHNMKVLDLGGSDGYDMSDWLDDNRASELDALVWNASVWVPTKPKREVRQRGRQRGRRGKPGLPYEVSDVVYALGGRMYGGNRGLAYCPAHDDERSGHPGLSLSATQDDYTVVYCHSGCDFKKLQRAILPVMRGE